METLILIGVQMNTKGKNMENTKATTKENKEMEKQERKEKREIEYKNTHFYLSVDNGDKVSRIPLSGYFTENSVIFTYDSNAYYVIVNDTMGGCFVKAYTRCKETAKIYYVKSTLVKASQTKAFGFIEEVACNMDFATLYNKAKVCKGFKEGKSARLLEVAELCNNKAKKVADKKAKLNAKINANEAVAV